MIKLTTENTQKAIAKCRQLRLKVIFTSERVFEVKSSNSDNSYTVCFDVRNAEKFVSRQGAEISRKTGLPISRVMIAAAIRACQPRSRE